MLFDDEKWTASALRRLLEERGLKVAHAGQPREGAEAVERGEADLVIIEAEPEVEDFTAYERRREELGRQYAGSYIAMHDGEVIGVGATAADAARAGIRGLGRPRALFVIRAGEPIPEPEWSDIRPDAPRKAVGDE